MKKKESKGILIPENESITAISISNCQETSFSGNPTVNYPRRIPGSGFFIVQQSSYLGGEHVKINEIATRLIGTPEITFTNKNESRDCLFGDCYMYCYNEQDDQIEDCSIIYFYLLVNKLQLRVLFLEEDYKKEVSKFHDIMERGVYDSAEPFTKKYKKIRKDLVISTGILGDRPESPKTPYTPKTPETPMITSNQEDHLECCFDAYLPDSAPSESLYSILQNKESLF